MLERKPIDRVLKHGTGYDLVVREVGFEVSRRRLHLGIRCHTCNLTSFQPKDITECYCACCHRFHEDQSSGDRVTHASLLRGDER